jgi:hypothetical protein
MNNYTLFFFLLLFFLTVVQTVSAWPALTFSLPISLPAAVAPMESTKVAVSFCAVCEDFVQFCQCYVGLNRSSRLWVKVNIVPVEYPRKWCCLRATSTPTTTSYGSYRTHIHTLSLPVSLKLPTAGFERISICRELDRSTVAGDAIPLQLPTLVTILRNHQ